MPFDDWNTAVLTRRLLLDFLGKEAAEALTSAAWASHRWNDIGLFFRSYEFRRRALALLCAVVLGRSESKGDAWLSALVEDTDLDLVDIAIEVAASEEYFVEQCGGNSMFFIARIATTLPGDATAFRTEALTTVDARRSFLRVHLRSSTTRHFLQRAVYDGLSVFDDVRYQLAATNNAGDVQFGIEDLLSQAVREAKYTDDARRGHSSWSLTQQRFAANLVLVARDEDLLARREADDLAHRILRSASSSLEAARLVNSFLCKVYSPASRLGRALWSNIDGGREAASPLLCLTDLLSQKNSALPVEESEYRDLARPLAEAIVRSWIESFNLSCLVHGKTLHQWTERLIENDGVKETLSQFLISEAVLGIASRLLDASDSIAPPPGCFVDGQIVPDSCAAIVSTSFFYWYDNVHGISFIACPDTRINEPGEDSLSVAPSSQDVFTYRSTLWHRHELVDMIDAGINVVMPVSYTTPFSSASSAQVNTDALSPLGRYHFADFGLRVFRRAWRDLGTDQRLPPRVAMFYDTSSLNRANVFDLQVDFTNRFANAWFYESIRNFFSHFPSTCWATYDGKPIVFVYHPSFGHRANETIYPYVRRRFRQDFDRDIYIVTAAEEEAPRVLQKDRIASDVSKLQTERGIDTLAGVLAKDDLYASVLFDDQTYKTMLLRRLVPRGNIAVLLSRYDGEPLNEISKRYEFARTILMSEEFIWELVEKWFRQFLRCSFDNCDPRHKMLAASIRRTLSEHGDWLAALAEIICTDLFFAASGGTEDRFADWIFQAVAMKHVNNLCTPDYHPIYAREEAKLAFLDDLRRESKASAVNKLLLRSEFCEGIVSSWYFDYYGWYNPGPADNSFYWSAAISPVIRGVASIGPGYDQKKLRHRPKLYMPRRDGATYTEAWDWINSMRPCPAIVHLETWNEFFEGTALCDSREYGRRYIELTKIHSDRFLSIRR